jgi:hypothetical protein
MEEDDEMRWPWRDGDKDGKPDDYPLDTWKEFFLAWIGICLSILVVIAIARMIFG